jgi:Uma2 family endonuclease
MSAVTTLPWGRPLTRDDLEALPDDGHRYELLDGALLVTPAPGFRHQRTVVRLSAALMAVVPAGLEVLSPSTRRIDLVLKHDRYRAAGCPHYWVVDPEEPSIRAWRLDGETYVEAGHAVGNALLELSEPFPVRLRPADLVR